MYHIRLKQFETSRFSSKKISENATARHLGWQKNQKMTVLSKNEIIEKKDHSKINPNQLININLPQIN